jgi:hypothetical protein
LFTFLIEKGRGIWSYFFLFYSFILVVVDWFLIFDFLLLLLILRLLNKNMVEQQDKADVFLVAMVS